MLIRKEVLSSLCAPPQKKKKRCLPGGEKKKLVIYAESRISQTVWSKVTEQRLSFKIDLRDLKRNWIQKTLNSLQ